MGSPPWPGPWRGGGGGALGVASESPPAAITAANAGTADRARGLELHMDPPAEDIDRASVRVVRGVPDALVVGGEPQRLEEIHAVEDVDGALRCLAATSVADGAGRAAPPEH